MILANHGIISSSGALSFDSDALAFMTAASITDNTQKTAINTLVTDLKAYNIWTKMKAVYPFVGGSATSHKYNLKDPRDLDAAYRLVFSGGWTHSSTGALPNGTTAYADTIFLPSVVYSSNANNVGVSFYKDKAVAMINGSYDATNRFLYGQDSNDIEGRLNSDSSTPFTVNYVSSGIGFFSTNKVNSNALNAYHNGNSVGTITKNSGLSTFNSYIGARNNNNVGNTFDNVEQRFVSYHDGLTNTEVSNLYKAVQLFNTTLNRQV